MAEARPVLAIRIPRPWTTEEEFLQQEIDTVSRNGILLLGTHSRPQGTILRFELTLLDGTPLVRGEGRVVSYTEEAFRGEPGLLLKFTRLDPKSKAFIDRIAAMRAGPQSAPASGPVPMSMSGPSPAVTMAVTGATNVQGQPPSMAPSMPPAPASVPAPPLPSARPPAPSYGDDGNESTISMPVDFNPAVRRTGSSPGFSAPAPRTSSSSHIPVARPSSPPPLPPQAQGRASAPPPPPSFPSSPPTATLQRAPSVPPPLPPAARKSMPPPLPPGAMRAPSAPPPAVASGASGASVGQSVAPATMASPSPRPPSVRPPANPPPQVRQSQPPPLPPAAAASKSSPPRSRGGRARTVGVIPDREHMLAKLRERAATLNPSEKKRILEAGNLSR